MATVEQTMLKVQRILTGPMGLRVQVEKKGLSLRFSNMSTSVSILVRDWGVDGEGEPRTLVHLSSLLLREVPVSPQLLEWIAMEGGRFWVGHVQVFESQRQGEIDLWMVHNLLGDYLDAEELAHGVDGVLTSADRLDEELKERFGGKRWIDS